MAKKTKRFRRTVRKKESRLSLEVKVRAPIRNLIDEAARESGRTQSQEAEAQIEKAFTYDAILDAMRMTVAQIQEGSVDAAFRAAGYSHVHTPHGKVWLPKGFPLKQIIALIPPDDSSSG